MSARDFLTAFAASRERPGMDAGTRAFVQALDEREKAELRMLLGMEEPQSSVAAQSNQPASRDSGSTASVEGASSAGRYDADETDTAVFQYAQYEELLRSASPQTRAQLLGAFDDEDEYDGNEHQHQLAPAYTDPGSGSAGRAQMGSVKVVGLAEDDLEDGLALPAARLAGISLSSDGGSDSSSPPAAFIDVAGDGLQDHPLIQAQDALRNGFGSVTTPFNSSPTSIGNFSAGAYTRHDSRHEKISSPEVRAIFGADVPEGAVSFGGGGFGGAPRIPSWKITGTQQTAPFMDGLDIAFAASAWIDNTK